ncbi:MAG: class I SAM-dependent methyltransferase [Candidatus Latescibacteria bacterium]|nr:class I SAM-dependent methyltransferase [Candidatus Latescibacterota bacterium]MBT7369423.1 class I SAM-dependent methyltransferase [Gammaproteobacteria bacterium]
MVDPWKDPDPEAIAFATLVQQEGGRLVHDLGCGSGRHVRALSKIGLSIVASDLTTEEVASCKRETPSIYPVVGSMLSSPIESDTLDGVLAVHVIYHALPEDISQTIAEVYRTLKPSGYFYLTLASHEHGSYGVGEMIGKHTFLPLSGIIHHFTSLRETESLLDRFNLVDRHTSQIDYVTKSEETIRCTHWRILAQKGQ